VDDFFHARLFVVVRIRATTSLPFLFVPLWHRRATLKASKFMMMRTPIRLSFFALAATFSAYPFQQASAPAMVPATMSAAPKINLAEKLSLDGLPNSAKISENLFRGAQPLQKGYPQLKNLGITVVVDLHNTGPEMKHERQIVEGLGMRYISMPASGISGPTDEQIAQFLKIVLANPNDKIFVHCKRGADRTGVAVAAFRITQQRWNIDQAYNEMLQFHFHTYLIPMSHHVKQFPQDFAQNPIFFDLRIPPAAPSSN
jgi:protein tyrosine phosphatase (PTP) superfamily phosphohydrolase (DUF442 family)